jgi:hypothetical protein
MLKSGASSALVREGYRSARCRGRISAEEGRLLLEAGQPHLVSRPDNLPRNRSRSLDISQSTPRPGRLGWLCAGRTSGASIRRISPT